MCSTVAAPPATWRSSVDSPEQQLSITLVANTDRINGHRLALQIADVFLEADASATEPPPATVSVPTAQLDALVGRYWNGVDRSLAITRHDGELRYAIDGGPTLTLLPVGPRRFRMLGGGTTTYVEFTPDDDERETIHVLQERGEVATYRAYQPVRRTEQQLQDYVGEYFSDELGTVYSLTCDAGQLHVSHVRFHANTLTPIEGDAFRNDGWRFTTLSFERGKDQRIAGFRLHSTRNKHVRFRRL